MLKQTGEAGNDILEGLGQERRGNEQWKTLLYLLEHYFKMPPLESPCAVWIQCVFLYCVVHCTSHHGSSVVCKSSGPSSCLEKRVQTFLWPQDPLPSASYWFFQAFSLTHFLGWELSPQPAHDTHQAQDENACSSQHPSPHQSCPFSPAPCWGTWVWEWHPHPNPWDKKLRFILHASFFSTPHQTYYFHHWVWVTCSLARKIGKGP